MRSLPQVSKPDRPTRQAARYGARSFARANEHGDRIRLIVRQAVYAKASPGLLRRWGVEALAKAASRNLQSQSMNCGPRAVEQSLQHDRRGAAMSYVHAGIPVCAGTTMLATPIYRAELVPGAF